MTRGGTCAALFALAAILRLAYLVAFRPDFANYNVALATTFLDQGYFAIDGVRTTDVELVYPLFLAVAHAVTGSRVMLVQAIQIAVSSLGAVFLYLLADALAGRRAIAVASAVLFALYPLLVWHAVTPDESALLTALLIAFAWVAVTAATSARACAAGVLLGLAVLTRSTVLPLVVLTPAVLALQGRRAVAGICLATTIAIVAPAAARNYRLGGTAWPARSGLNFYIGNSRYADGLLPDYTPDNLILHADWLVEREGIDLPEGAERKAAVDRALTRLAWREMSERPLRTLWLKARYVAYFFWPRLVPTHAFVEGTRLEFPSGGGVVVLNSPPRPWIETMAFTATYCPVFALAMAGIWRRRRDVLRGDAILWAIAFTFVAVHTLYFPTTRYTTPACFVLLFYAAAGLEPICTGRWRARTIRCLLAASGPGGRPRRGCVYLAAGLARHADFDDMARRSFAGPAEPRDDLALQGFLPWEAETYRHWVRPGDRILVVGCGTGRDLLPFVEGGHEVVGVDPSTASVAFLRRVLRDRVPPAEILEELVEYAALPGSFDVVTFSRGSYSCIRETARRVAVLRKAASHLNHGGRIIITYAERTEGEGSPLGLAITRLVAWLTRSDWRPEPHDRVWRWEYAQETVLHCEHWFTPEEIARETRAAGLTEVGQPARSGASVIVLRL